MAGDEKQKIFRTKRMEQEDGRNHRTYFSRYHVTMNV